MSSFRHRTPRYLGDRMALAWYEHRHPQAPWLTREAVRFLDSWLRPSDRCFEWGAGRSTRWIGERVARLRSIEHDQGWFEEVRSATFDLPGVTVELVAPDRDAYVGPIWEEHAPDLVLIDGLHRDHAALASVDRVRAGGLLVLDNAERYLPSASRSPEAIGNPHASECWREFDERTRGWRRYWTCNGVFDTAVFFRP